MQFLNFFGNIFGYLLWWLYLIVKNYGVAIILFTIVLKIVMFPFSVKQQKSMAAQSRLSAKQQELQKKYANDKTKYAEEIQALYQKEGINPSSGCLTALIPFPIMMGLYYAIIRPLSNVLHLSSDVVNQATSLLQRLPGISSSFNQANGYYAEIHIVKHFESLRPFLTMFSEQELNSLENVSKSFNFLGLDLLGTPQGSAFSTMLWLIPVLCLVSSWGQQFYTTKTTPSMQNQQGCMKYMMYVLPLITVYFAYTMPAAIGFYWVISSLIGLVQTVITNKYFGPANISARAEAERAALRFIEEEKIQKLPINEQKILEKKIYGGKALQASSENVSSKGNEKNSKKKASAKSKSNDYLGAKK